MQISEYRVQDLEKRARCNSQFAICTFHLCRGFTLVELLVVIAIISMVTIATVPMVLPALDTRRIREASRIVSTQFASAQSEALAKGRSVGVWIERLPGGKTAAMDLFTCEVPEPYCGGTQEARADAFISAAGVFSFMFRDSAEYGLAGKMIRAGDLIRFDSKGQWYRISADPAKNDFDNDDQGRPTILRASCNNRTMPYQGIVIEPTNVAGPIPPITLKDRGSQFAILRQPVKSAASPTQLPGGAVLDLYYSGMTSSGYFGDNPTSSLNNPILVMFDKTGALESFYWNSKRLPIQGPLYFLVGKRSKLPRPAYNKSDPPETQSEKHNFRDLENIWICINPQTGLVTTAEVGSIDQTVESGFTGGNDAAWLSHALPISRQYATSAQNMGGR